MSKTLFDIVSDFPYYEEAPARFTDTLKSYHAFKVQGIDAILGYIPNTLVQSIPWPKEHWMIDCGAIVLLNPPDNAVSTHTQIIQNAINRMIEAGYTDILKGWRNERFPIYGPSGDVILEIERSASSLFGIVTSGVQMLCYVKDAKNGIRLWIAKRSMRKQTYPGMLDCTAAGALSAGESPRSAMMLEATDEASIAREIIESGMRYVGAISYFHMKVSSIALSEGSSTAVLLPEVEYLYELQLDEGTVPRPKDSEVEDFRLWNVDQVLDALGRGTFKPNSAVVVIDFLTRHGVITPETEPMCKDIIRRLHRRLPFPTADWST
ncbi:thiamine pyrophosphokinase-related protein [Aspergillus novofumigatus IBT 16806]|uniref:Putative NUDIX family hydrolase n=1 Tax=Aspergillus novofumigatus (strain IBT 16806) TaxID=1392255 RepID=A0A2I1BYZ7_ASPN1|nr:putative NUDIX family hydrolase [Aspergillus novofumigatus IBT 16806]PKX90600.1 putative NUDIX family hydrolase [Aspergillus novofumigatus IBT 16806]